MQEREVRFIIKNIFYFLKNTNCLKNNKYFPICFIFYTNDHTYYLKSIAYYYFSEIYNSYIVRIRWIFQKNGKVV